MTLQPTAVKADIFLPWLTRAKAGDRQVYYTGVSATLAPHVAVPTGEDDKPPRVVRIAGLAWSAYKLGLVYLFQRRLASHSFEYIAMRSRAPVTNDLLLELVGA